MINLIAAIGGNSAFFNILRPTLMILMVLLSIVVTILVLMQDGNTSEITGLGGSSNNSETHYGKNKAKSREGLLKLLTLIFSALLLIISVLYFIFRVV